MKVLFSTVFFHQTYISLYQKKEAGAIPVKNLKIYIILIDSFRKIKRRHPILVFFNVTY